MDIKSDTNSLLPTLYHITPADNKDSIMKKGLIPQVGERSARAGETSPAIYLFPSIEDAEQALLGWLGEEIGDEELLFLELNLPQSYKDSLHKEGFEVLCRKPISPKYIRMFSESDDSI